MGTGGVIEDAEAAGQRAVLVVVRTLTTLSRLLDILTVIDRDPRITPWWTIDVGSRFADGLAWHLQVIGAKQLSWAEAVGRRFHLVLAAHVDSALRQLSGEIVVVQHGIGFNRQVPFRTGDTGAPVGISPMELLLDGRVVPDHLGVSDECLLDQLAHTCPEALDRAFVAGDPTSDRIQHNRHAWRDVLRAELGARPGQRVVCVSTTWNETSLWGKQNKLIERLLGQLPAEEYLLLLVMHPNIWVDHGRYHLQGILADARECGLVTVLPYSDWHVGPVVADLVVGDHGSVSLYAAALGTPFFLTGSGESELAPGSTTREFVDVARRLDIYGDLRAQVADALSRPVPADVVAAAGRPLVRHQGKALQLLQAKLYEILGLRPSYRPKHLRYTPTFIRPHPCTSFHIAADQCRFDDSGGELTLERFPAALAEFRPGADGREYVLVAEDIEADNALLDSAEVVVSSHTRSPAAAHEWVDRTLASMFCSLAGAAVDDGFLLRCRHGPAWRVQVSTPGKSPSLASLVACAMHRWLVTRSSHTDDFTLTMNIGEARHLIIARAT